MGRLEEIERALKYGPFVTIDDGRWLMERLRQAEAVVEAAELVYRAHQHGACMCVKCHALGAALDAYRKEDP